jgi:hypothetical protein
MPRACGWVLGIGSGVAGMIGGLLELYGTGVLNHPTYPYTEVCFVLLAVGGAGIAVAAFIPRLSSILLALTAIGFTGLNTTFLLWPAEIFQLPMGAIDVSHVRILYLLCLLTTSGPWGTSAAILWALGRQADQRQPG